MHDSDGDSVVFTSPSETFQLRGYQTEMVEESMKANIIVAMDTGSGKTHIAIERARAELETCEPDKLVWFLAPTVALCEQQHKVFQSNLPGFGYQLLCGRDDVLLWTTQSDWDAVLHNVRIVMSTHQVLLDALTHGFVQMGRLSLLIFDEAHHCTLKHPAHRIMLDFYMPQLRSGNQNLPRVLGLSASPVTRATASQLDLKMIEQNLHATVRTPKLHRSELLRYVHQPELIQVSYPTFTDRQSSDLLLALRNAYWTYDLMQDPYVLDLLQQQKHGCNVSRQLQKLWDSGRTYCNDELKQLVSKAEAMGQELGSSTMDYYLCQCINRFMDFTRISDEQLLDMSTNERQHLLRIFQTLPLSDFTTVPFAILDSLTPKVHVLIDTLVAEATENPNFAGLVFIEQRVWVASLAEILTAHPRTKDLLRVGTYVGTSQISKRKSNICTYAEPKNQQNTLDDFKAGVINLVLATSVLEEGIDVSSCHLVVDFERPKNLKSFVQRRGRARQQRSRYYIFVPNSEYALSSMPWQSLEAEMRQAYEDEKRRIRSENEKEEIEEYGSRYFKVDSTGALLTLENASQHLYHFCSRLASGSYVDTRPEFDFTKIGGQITAKVTLPIFVDPKVRTATSSQSWRTEKMAQKDAAFEAYKALYLAGLVNDNLLPVTDEYDEEAAQHQIRDDQPSLISVSHTLDPWQGVSQYGDATPHAWYRTLLEVTAPGEEPLHMILSTPSVLPIMPDLLLHWNKTKHYSVKASWIHGASLSDAEIQLLRSVTWKLLRTVFGTYVEEQNTDFLYLLAPCGASGRVMSHAELCEWHTATEGQSSALELLEAGNANMRSWGLVSQLGDMRKFIVKDVRTAPSQTSPGGEEILVEAIRFPKRRDFLHPVVEGKNKNEAYTRIESLEAASCVVAKLPTSYTILALLFPSIAHKVEVHMVADTLRKTLLEHVNIDVSHLPLIVLALTSSAIDEGENYQRVEFLGDCILKFIASLHLMATHLLMPEGMLTGKKGKLVSNGYLTRAALAAGLDKFIFYKRFTGAKWRPRYISQILVDATPPAKQEKSSKVIADVIESLVGVSYLIGGLAKAFACVQVLLPLENWMPIPEANETLYRAAPSQDTVTNLDLLERLLGHTFNNKALLLEALTHSSFRGLNTHCSYEREEFLGDAVLDYIITTRLYAHKPELPHQKMHGIRTAMVNASFLAYCMFETTVDEELTNKQTLQPELHQRALWQFLRSTSHELVAARSAAVKQHAEVRAELAVALEHDARFPWHILSRTDPPKFLSDIVESVIGALYIDSRGSLAVCEEFVRRLGILPCLERVLRDGVDCLHPKERLGILAVEKNVRYVRVTGDGDGDANDPDAETNTGYRVQVKIGGDDVGGVVKGVKRLQAETIAAWKAVEVLEKAGSEDMVVQEDEDDEFFDAEEGGGVMLEDV